MHLTDMALNALTFGYLFLRIAPSLKKSCVGPDDPVRAHANTHLETKKCVYHITQKYFKHLNTSIYYFRILLIPGKSIFEYNA